jgi:hypothetical protein
MPKIKTFRSYHRAAAKSFVSGQGFHSLSFDGEHRIVNRALAKKSESAHSFSTPLTKPAVTRGDVECRKVLSENAKLTIRAATESGRFHGRSKAKESPFMAPSENPDKYSPVSRVDLFAREPHTHTAKWCSFCKDFGECLVLCAGCRVGVCTNTDESSNGCLDWDPIIDDPNFVFYCPLCAMAAKRPCAVSVERFFQTLVTELLLAAQATGGYTPQDGCPLSIRPARLDRICDVAPDKGPIQPDAA